MLTTARTRENALSTAAAVAERHRVQEHLQRAERFARSRHVSHLSFEQQTVRELLLEELAIYRRSGVFPQNPDFDVPMPYFIDAAGTRCAMAHLMEIGGAAELVAEIARTRNNAFVEELADDPRVLAWLEAAGLSTEEAARIQPSYCASKPADCVCSRTPGAPATAVARGTLWSEPGQMQQWLVVNELVGTAPAVCATVKVGDKVFIDINDHDGSGTPTSVTASLVVYRDAKGNESCRAEEVHMVKGGSAKCDNGLAYTQLPADLSPADTLAALASNDCKASLNAKGAAWSADNECGESGLDAFGCRAVVGNADSSITAVTAAVLGAVVAYRAKRRRRGTRT